jgi:hypothetical protein
VENQLGRVVDVLPGLIWTVPPDGHVDFVHQRFDSPAGRA